MWRFCEWSHQPAQILGDELRFGIAYKRPVGAGKAGVAAGRGGKVSVAVYVGVRIERRSLCGSLRFDRSQSRLVRHSRRGCGALRIVRCRVAGRPSNLLLMYARRRAFAFGIAQAIDAVRKTPREHD